MAAEFQDKSDKESRPSPIDVHVGSRIRLRRSLLGMSQERLGEALGLTFQQVQKYERGVNRVGASRLFDLSRVMDVPISFFFDDMPESSAPLTASHSSRKTVGGFENSADHLNEDTMNRRETLELVRSYYKIVDLGVRKKLVELMKSLAFVDSKNSP